MEVVDSSDDEGPGTQPRTGGGKLFGALGAMVAAGAPLGAQPRPSSKLERLEAEERRIHKVRSNSMSCTGRLVAKFAFRISPSALFGAWALDTDSL